jgi:alkanesulfonate monooxygenase SsuD/methylene tetrahydromethanopterin reductase-like flavin-dependent oxidoreductase (luciferase family)
MKLGTGTVNMPNNHPARVAAEIAMLDHMLDGRFIFGISPGGLLSDAEVFGNLDANRNEMFLECVNQVLAIWTGEPPYHLRGKYWTVVSEKQFLPDIGQGFLPKPLQRPHPPIVVTAVACERAGRPADPANWRVAKSICVADDDKTARDYATDPNSPYRFYYKQLFTKLKANGRIELFKTHRDQPDDEVTLDSICDQLIIYGSPNKVADEILAFRDKVGDFGTLLYAGKDWADPALGKRSMVLLAEKVMPKVNAAIGSKAQAAE